MNKLYVLVLTLSASGTISTPRGTEQTNEDGWGLNENIFLLFRSSDAASSLRPGSQSDQPNLESRYNALIFSSKFTGCSNEMQCDTTLICLRRTDRDHAYHWFTITFKAGPDTPFIFEFSFSCASLVTPSGNDCTSNRTSRRPFSRRRRLRSSSPRSWPCHRQQRPSRHCHRNRSHGSYLRCGRPWIGIWTWT